MSRARLTAGFVPLVDAAPLVVAREMGFAAEEGLTLDLVAAPSWSTLRDMLAFGRVEAAHMLAPIPVAASLGFGLSPAMAGIAGGEFAAVSVLSVNGDVIGVSEALADRMRQVGHDFAFNDARAAGEALIAAAEHRLRIGVPFVFSMHAELLYYWLSALGLPAPQEVDIRTVPPPLMAEALKSGEIDAFCVGEPWGSIAVEQGVGTLILPTRAIWSFAPEKVLAMRSDWIAAEPGLTARLVRAVWQAGRWLADPAHRLLAAELLAQRAYLDLAPEIIDRALSGAFTISPRGEQRSVRGFVGFHHGNAGFPWASQAQWIAQQLAGRTGLDRAEARLRAAKVFRADIYRSALAGTGATLPPDSSRPEGAEPAADSPSGLGAQNQFVYTNMFFDRRVFDPTPTES